MNLTQRQLRMFVATAATGNISRASEALHMSQPALSRGLLEFESHYPLDVFELGQDLSSLPLLKEAADTSIMHMLRTHGSDIVGQMGQGTEVSSLALQLAFAQQGLGVAVVSALGASHPMAQGLRFVPVRPAILRDVFTIQRRDRAPSPSARALMQAVGMGLQRVQLHPAVRIAASPD